MISLKCYSGQTCAEITQGGAGPDVVWETIPISDGPWGKYEFMWYLVRERKQEKQFNNYHLAKPQVQMQFLPKFTRLGGYPWQRN